MIESRADAIPSHSDVVITCFAMLVVLLACPALKAPNVHLCARIALLTVLMASFIAPLQSIIPCVAMQTDPNKFVPTWLICAYQLIGGGSIVATHDGCEALAL